MKYISLLCTNVMYIISLFRLYSDMHVPFVSEKTLKKMVKQRENKKKFFSKVIEKEVKYFNVE